MLLALALASAASAPAPAPASDDQRPPMTHAGLELIPGLDEFLLGDKVGAAVALGAFALPAALWAANAPPIVFADLEPPNKISLFALTTQEVWSVEIYRAFARARVASRNAGFKQAFVPKSIAELALAPFTPAHVFDWRTWVAIGFLYVSDSLLGLLLPDPPSDDGPFVLDARAAHLFGRRVSPTVAYSASAAGGALLALHAGVGEEALFRGVFQDELESETSRWPALFITSALFGAAHVGGVNQTSLAKQFVGATIGGLVLGFLYQAAGYDLGKNIAAHFYFDALAFALDGLYPARKGNNVFGIQYDF